MVKGFQEIEALKGANKGLSTSAAFERVFKFPFKSSTYSDSRRVWMNAPKVDWDNSIKVGRATGGEWSVLVKRLRKL